MISRRQVKTRPVTLKREYRDMCLNQAKEIQRLKRHNASIEDNLKDANKWANEWQCIALKRDEEIKRLKEWGLIKTILIYGCGFTCGIILMLILR